MEESSVVPVAEKGKRTLRRRPPRPMAAPWLVFTVGNNDNDQNFVNLCDPHNRVYKKSIPELGGGTSFWQYNSHQGWFIILFEYPDYNRSNRKFGDCFLWNPESLETVELPNMLQWLQKPDFNGVYGFVLSSPPTNSDSMVYFILRKTTNLMFCCPGKDKKWRTQKLPIEDDRVFSYGTPSSMICVDGKLHIPYYSYRKYGYFVVEKKLDLGNDGGGGGGGDESLSVMSFNVSIKIEDSALRPSLVYESRNCIASSKEIFMVIRYLERSELLKIVAIKVFKMNFSLMEWEEVDDLGDHVLFLGRNTSASLSCTKLGLKKGCIYFTEYPHIILYKFDPEWRRISVSLSCLNIATPYYFPYWMSMSTNFRVDEGSIEANTLDNYKDEELVIRTKVEETSIKQRGAWAILNENVIGLIASYLHAADYLRFRAICEANRLSIPEVKSRMSCTNILHATLPPWLVFAKKRDTIYNFIEPMCNNQRYLINLSEFLLDSTIHFSKLGWLLISRGHRSLFFFNPFTRAMIQLPDLPIQPYEMVGGISFSSLPTSSDCKVFALTKQSEWVTTTVSIFIISRGDVAWDHRTVPHTVLGMEFWPRSSNPIFCNESLYYLDPKGTLGVFSPVNFSWKVLAKSQIPCNSIYRCYLVECEEKLLSVFVGYSGKWIRVFSLDWEEKLWVEVKSLQKNMLFISSTSCLSVIAPNTSMGNRIYLSSFHEEKIVFFSLDTGMYHSVGGQHSAKDLINSEEQLYCSWIEPIWSKNTVQELNWLDKLDEHGVENGDTNVEA